MYMFLPFLLALILMLSTITGKEKVSYTLCWILFIVTALSFIHHVTDPLNLSF